MTTTNTTSARRGPPRLCSLPSLRHPLLRRPSVTSLHLISIALATLLRLHLLGCKGGGARRESEAGSRGAACFSSFVPHTTFFVPVRAVRVSHTTASHVFLSSTFVFILQPRPRHIHKKTTHKSTWTLVLITDPAIRLPPCHTPSTATPRTPVPSRNGASTPPRLCRCTRHKMQTFTERGKASHIRDWVCLFLKHRDYHVTLSVFTRTKSLQRREVFQSHDFCIYFVWRRPSCKRAMGKGEHFFFERPSAARIPSGQVTH